MFGNGEGGASFSKTMGSGDGEREGAGLDGGVVNGEPRGSGWSRDSAA